MNKEEETNVISNLTDFLNNGLEELEETINTLCETSKRKIFYRKIRFKNKIKRRYMIKINPISDYLIDSLLFSLRMINRH